MGVWVVCAMYITCVVCLLCGMMRLYILFVVCDVGGRCVLCAMYAMSVTCVIRVCCV